MAPLGMDISYYAARYRASFRFFSAECFVSTYAYSRLLVSAGFYESFGLADWLLILQTDVYVFSDDLDRWMECGYDYVGAPWPEGVELRINAGVFAKAGGLITKVFVGNGGFSLRRRQACLDLINEHPELVEWFKTTGSNEDLFFALIGSLSEDFRLPNQFVASKFAIEIGGEQYTAVNDGKLPMGTHAFAKHSPEFWGRHIPNIPAEVRTLLLP